MFSQINHSIIFNNTVRKLLKGRMRIVLMTDRCYDKDSVLRQWFRIFSTLTMGG